MSDNYCKECGLQKQFPPQVSDYEIMWHYTENHEDALNEFLRKMRVDNICVDCGEKFEAEAKYDAVNKKFRVRAYCPDCVSEHPIKTVLMTDSWDSISRSSMSDFIDMLKPRKELRVLEDLPKPVRMRDLKRKTRLRGEFRMRDSERKEKVKQFLNDLEEKS